MNDIENCPMFGTVLWGPVADATGTKTEMIFFHFIKWQVDMTHNKFKEYIFFLYNIFHSTFFSIKNAFV